MNFAPPQNALPVGPPTGFFAEGAVPIQPPRELIKGVTAFDGVTFIGGQSGAGKTFVAVDMAVALATPEATFFGRPVREQVGVIFLAAEGAGTLANRIDVAKRQRRIDDRLPLLWKADVPNLSDRKNVADVIVSLKEAAAFLNREFSVRLGAVFVDTVSAAFGMKDENDNAEAARIVSGLRSIGRATNALILPIHHAGKNAEAGLRGGSAYRANADGIIFVNATRNENTGVVTSRSLAVAKYRDGEEGPIGDFDLKFMRLGEDEFGDVYGNCYIQPSGIVTTQTKSTRLSPKSRLALEALHSLLADQGKPLPGIWQIPGDPKSVTLDCWRSEVLTRGIVDRDAPNPREPFRRIKIDLQNRHLIAEREGVVWSASQ